MFSEKDLRDGSRSPAERTAEGEPEEDHGSLAALIAVAVVALIVVLVVVLVASTRHQDPRDSGVVTGRSASR